MGKENKQELEIQIFSPTKAIVSTVRKITLQLWNER